MANLKTKLFDLELLSPFILGSGPLSYSGEGLERAYNAGFGAITTKTIRSTPAKNPYTHMVYSGSNSLVNCEKWADYTAERWIDQEIPYAKSKGVVVIGSVGHTPEEVELYAEAVEKAGADMIELVSYQVGTMVPMLRIAKQKVKVPVLAKISPNWPNVVQDAGACLKAGADGITAMDSYGPVLRIDLASKKPLLGGNNGFGWLSGSAIKPIALRIVAEVAKKYPGTPIIGLGGITNGEDALEMLMAGASAVGLATAPILKGLDVVKTISKGLEKLLDQYGYPAVQSASGVALPNLWPEEQFKELEFHYNPDKCIECLKCVKVCPYVARSLENKVMSVNKEECRGCGLCVSVCPREALTCDYWNTDEWRLTGLDS